MAGRPKPGIDYAGWSVDMFDGDTKIDKLLDAQGSDGFLIYFYLCQMAYKHDGYFYRWSYDDSATTARRLGCGIGSKTVENTVGLCLRIGLFDKPLFDGHGILTSRGIQRRFYTAIQGRRVKSVIADYWLLENEESKGLEKCALYPESPPKNDHLQAANDHLQAANDVKGKERKGKESKEDDPRARESSSGSAVSFYLDRIDPTPAQYTLEALEDFERDLGPEVCIRAMMVALEARKANWSYINGILKNKRRDGIRSLAAWDAQEAERRNRKEKSSGSEKAGESPPEYRTGEWL